MNEKIYKRLEAQAEEAASLGLVKLAHELMTSLKKRGINLENKQSLNEISKEAIWDIVFEVSDFYDLKELDSGKISKFVEEISHLVLNKIKDAIMETSEEAKQKMQDGLVPGEERNI